MKEGIGFAGDREVRSFTATVHRKVAESSPKKSEIPEELSITSGKTSGKILAELKQDEELTSMMVVTEHSIERNIRRLKVQGRLRRIGPAKGDHWEVL